MRARAGRGDSDLAALEVLRPGIGRELALHQSERERGVALQHEGLHLLPLRLHLERVLETARHDVGAAADQGLQRLGTAGEIEDLDLEAFVLEVAQPLGEGERQVVERRLAADGDGEVGFFGWGGVGARRGDGCCDQREQQSR